MWHIIQNQTTHCQRTHIVNNRSLAYHTQLIVRAAELQRDKGIQAARSILQIAQSHKVVDTMVDIFYVTIQHRSIRVETHFVRLLVHLQPLRRRTFARANLCTNLLVENLRTTARDRLHTSLLEQLQARLDGQARLHNHIVQLHRRKSLDAHLGHNLLDAANHLGVVVQIALGMYSAHDVNLGCSALLARLNLREHLLHRIIPRTLLALTTTIGAETTIEQADVGRLEVEVLVIKDLIATLAHLRLGCKACQQPQRSLLP